MSYHSDLEKTVSDIAQPGKGILAADESDRTIKKRFDSISVESTEETRRFYRETLFTTPEANRYISGVILFEETLYQKTADGTPFPEYLSKLGIVPGIKVDKGLVDCVNANADEKTTQGLDGLQERLTQYKEAGARFAKWRATYTISTKESVKSPTMLAIKSNAVNLARYAAICQSVGIVPIVEPEVLMDGEHTLEECSKVSERVFRKVFNELAKHKVHLEGIILKPNMIVAGKDCKTQPSVEAVASETIKVLKRTVPAACRSINFLSGGQSPEQATQHLAAMNKMGNLPWHLSFSYGRALQAPVLEAWQGKLDNKQSAQDAFLKVAKANGEATS